MFYSIQQDWIFIFVFADEYITYLYVMDWKMETAIFLLMAKTKIYESSNSLCPYDVKILDYKDMLNTFASVVEDFFIWLN